MTPNGRDIIRAGYQAGRPVEAIARDCQSTPGSVKVIAHRMGWKHGHSAPAGHAYAGFDPTETPWGEELHG